jgi:methylated-DNA-[protein]-cysteine S-methyltransferase
MTELRIDQLQTPVGMMSLVTRLGSEQESLCALDFSDPDRMCAALTKRFGCVRFAAADDPGGTTSRLRAYFEGRLDAILDIAVDPGGTAFQRRVWKALRDVPCGETRSYKDIAHAIGSPNASRAVGTANARNPVGIVIPCHRVVQSGGSLGGYAGGQENKRWLLSHERALPRQQQQDAAQQQLLGG